MFKKNNLITTPGRIGTVIGKECVMSGKITGSDSVHIDGDFDGTVSIKGHLIIGESGAVEAELQAENITIAGRYTGTLEADNKLELKKTATATGTFKTNALMVEEGAVISGNIGMQLKEGTVLELKEAPREVMLEKVE